MIRVLIVDDEPAARRRLADMLAADGPALGAEVVGQAANGLQALQLCAELAPDLLLLDISMPEVDGFDVVRHLPAPRPLIIFQTAHDEHALQAFDHEAVDYVVKPVSRERLARAVERAVRRRPAGTGGGNDAPSSGPADELGVATVGPANAPTPQALARLQAALGHAALGTAARRPRLLVRAGRGHRLVPLAEITRFTARDGAVYAHAGDRPQLTDYTLAELEQRTAGRFVRVSRAALVNLEAVEAFVAESDGSATLQLADGTRLRASRRRTAVVRAALEG